MMLLCACPSASSFPVRKGALLFCFLIAMGQLLFSLGVQFKIYGLAVFGRFVFGLGGENLTVAQNNYVVRWFDGKRLALAFGLVVAFSRIGTSVNFVVSPKLANSAEGVPLTVWVAMGMCVLSFIACCLASLCDYWSVKAPRPQHERARCCMEQPGRGIRSWSVADH